MDLIERYLDAVRLFLPRDQRDDITAELRDVLLTRREEKEAEPRASADPQGGRGAAARLRPPADRRRALRPASST